MNVDELVNAGTTADDVPKGNTARQAVHALRGYAYQTLKAALAWIDIEEDGRLFLEVAEDYATIVKGALQATQVKDTKGSATVTLNRESIRSAIASFVDLYERNHGVQVSLHFFTTSEIGTELPKGELPGPGLTYWRSVARGADPSPLRTILESDRFSGSVQTFCKSRDDAALRRDLVERVHWDCGAPSFSTLRQELEERLIVIGRDRFSLSAEEARRLVASLVYHVLEKSIASEPEERVLTRADLYVTIDEQTRIPVTRAIVDDLFRHRSECLAKSLGGGPSHLGSTSEPEWLFDGATLPRPNGMVSRPVIKSAVIEALANFGTSVLVGSRGLGKSTVSRAVVNARFDAFFLADFQNADANRVRHMLDMVFARIGGLLPSALILKDVDYIDDRSVTLSLVRVIESLRRRDRSLIITCYQAPSAATLAALDLDPGCVVTCPYFLHHDVCELIRMNGADPDEWSPVAYVAGAGGHPHLTHAFVAGMAARQWPAQENEDFISRAPSSEAVEATHDAARRSLVRALPAGTRELLYRLSLTSGLFSRSLALTIGGTVEPVPQAGECMDQLIGPWIEAVGKGLFRVSPLAASFGRSMLPPERQRKIHETFAVEKLTKGAVDASDADTIMMHAIAGKSPLCLVRLAQSVLAADFRTLETLADTFLLLRFQRTDVPFYADDVFASIILRLAQFKLSVASAGNKIQDIVAALFVEIERIPSGDLRHVVEETALLIVLNTMGIANHLDNWLSLLCSLKSKIEASVLPEGPIATALQSAGSDVVGMLFQVGSAGIQSVERLEYLINQLAELRTSERTILLTEIGTDSSNCAVLINGPWTEQYRGERFDAADAVMRYRRMADRTATWRPRSLAVQCAVARATILDEHQSDSSAAVAVLEQAAGGLGDDPALGRALVKVLRHRGEYAKAVKIFRTIADHIGGDHPIERVFAFREAAISAAKSGEWLQAETWFLDADHAARQAHGDSMSAIAVGLIADAAAAALEAREVGRALTGLAQAVEELARVNPEETPRGAYCHRTIRILVLWARSRIEQTNGKFGGKSMDAGTCSDPYPSSKITKIRLVPLDVTWYMLAMAEIASSVDVGITATLGDRLEHGSIPPLEATLCVQQMQAAIVSLDAVRFADHFTTYIESSVYLSKRDDDSVSEIPNWLEERGLIPRMGHDERSESDAERAAIDAIMAYGIQSVMMNQSVAVTHLEAVMNQRYTVPYPGKPVLDKWDGKPVSLDELDQTVVTLSKAVLHDGLRRPDDFWVAGLRFFEWSNQSQFGRFLMAGLAAWLRSGWKRIATTQSFLLSRPRHTVPAIKEVLKIPADDRSFVAKLILVTSEAVGPGVEPSYRDSLTAMAEESESP